MAPELNIFIQVIAAECVVQRQSYNAFCQGMVVQSSAQVATTAA
jgi:hypothetical protein